jgi:hypothetical protein
MLGMTLVGCDKPDVTRNPEVAKEAAITTEVPHGSDILDELGVSVEVEHPFISEEQVRGAFTRAYEMLGVADPSITRNGWTVVIADSEDMTGAETTMQPRFKRGRVAVSAPMLPFSGTHEAVHFLMGEVTYNDWLPGFVSEFIAAQAEESAPPGVQPDSYEVLNRGILRLPFSTRTKNADREGAIGVNSNGAYDGLRYGLLRSITTPIGAEKARSLAREVYQLAADNRRFTSVAELKPIFERYGVGDCVLFEDGDRPGTYVDFFFNGGGLPVVVYKKISDRGDEGSFPGTLGIEYQKNGGMAYGLQVTTNPGGLTTDDGGMLAAHWADGVRIVVDGTSYDYAFTHANNTHSAVRVGN